MSRSLIFPLILFLVGCSIISSEREPSRIETDYIVEKGDTLALIGEKFQIPYQVIMKRNRIINPNKLEVGQLLVIPTLDQNNVDVLSNILGRDEKKPGAKTISIGSASRYIGNLQLPVLSGSFSSPFGWRNGSFHEGIDISAREGTPVYAAHDGQVIYSSKDLRGYGNTVVIRSDGFMTVYGHNDRNLVSSGDYVKKGDEIAKVGASGNARGNHCHFETRIRDSAGRYVAVNPWAFFRRSISSSVTN